jgi:hypothetical protein
MNSKGNYGSVAYNNPWAGLAACVFISLFLIVFMIFGKLPIIYGIPAIIIFILIPIFIIYLDKKTHSKL